MYTIRNALVDARNQPSHGLFQPSLARARRTCALRVKESRFLRGETIGLSKSACRSRLLQLLLADSAAGQERKESWDGCYDGGTGRPRLLVR
jgi:hypothetical protein